MTGDLFHSLRCDCGDQLEASLAAIESRGSGVFVYMRQEGRGIGLVNKLKAYALQDQGADTVDANARLGFADDLREYGVGAQILRDLGVRRMELITNNPRKIVGLDGYGLEVVRRLPLEMPANARNVGYLRTKKHRLGHLLEHV
jgi:3,4-dihydroxy 2-butanone 4-phosphate synthase/GTP cyclohydrolase II